MIVRVVIISRNMEHELFQVAPPRRMKELTDRNIGKRPIDGEHVAWRTGFDFLRNELVNSGN